MQSQVLLFGDATGKREDAERLWGEPLQSESDAYNEYTYRKTLPSGETASIALSFLKESGELTRAFISVGE